MSYKHEEYPKALYKDGLPTSDMKIAASKGEEDDLRKAGYKALVEAPKK